MADDANFQDALQHIQQILNNGFDGLSQHVESEKVQVLAAIEAARGGNAAATG